MQVLLKAPSEETCDAFETLLTGTFYYSDDCEGSEDVCYTIADALAEQVRRWKEQATASGVIAAVVILDDDELEEDK